MEEIVGHGKEPSNIFGINPNETNENEVLNVAQNKNPITHYSKLNIDNSLLIDINHLSLSSMISEGGYSIVYEGWYKTMPVAVKMMQPCLSASVSPDHRYRFVREIMMLSRVKHDNLVMFIGASMKPSMLIVTELMRGGSLKKYLWDMRPACPDLQHSLSFALDISRAMECLHANGIIHRDLKPANLVLTEDHKRLKLADFGLAREETVEEMMTSEAGTYRWMAPELFSTVPLEPGEKKHYDHKVDIYSFSIVLWELLTNTTPFKGMSCIQAAYAVAKNKRPSVENLPMDLVPLLESCWAEDPSMRPEFTVITTTLLDILNTLYPPETNPQVEANEQQSYGQVVDSPRTHHLMNKSGTMVDGRKSRSSSPNFFRWFEKCFSR